RGAARAAGPAKTASTEATTRTSRTAASSRRATATGATSSATALGPASLRGLAKSERAADAQIEGDRLRTRTSIDAKQGFSGAWVGVEAAKISVHKLRYGRALCAIARGNNAWPFIEEVIPCQVNRGAGDVVRPSRLPVEKRVEGDSQGAVVIRHQEEHLR